MLPQRIKGPSFAVVDLETTGFSPKYHHRIVEIAIVRISGGDEITDQWVTLVNPERDLGPTEIHGLTGADFLDAPRFGDIAGDVLDHLRDTVIVAHNRRFDLSFLDAEFARLSASSGSRSGSRSCRGRAASWIIPKLDRGTTGT